MAQLVVANSAYKEYPGGVIALRASDWLGPVRATLTTEANSLASSGNVVRDTQKVTSSILTAPNTAFQDADDTLVIDFAGIPFLIDMTYAVFISYLIEGDWDTSNSETCRLSATQAGFTAACDLGWYGDSTFYLSETDRGVIKYKARGREHFSLGTFSPGVIHVGDVVGNEVLHWRAYAQSGTTIEWLLDQIIFLPYVTSGIHAGEWRIQDFKVVSGALNDFGSLLISDGADGGDSNGKFTWHAYPEHSELDWSGDDGGGDSQKKSSYTDAEYMIRVDVNDFQTIENSNDGSETNAQAYSVHGARYRPIQTFVDDPFSRTVGGNSWGVSPQGFGYIHHVGAGVTISTNGSVGMHSMAGPGNAASAGSWLAGTSTSARIAAANMTLSGKVTPTFSEGSDPDRVARLKMGFRRPTDVGAEGLWYIRINLLAKTWALARSGNVVFSGAENDISSWFSSGSAIGYKIEIKRYLIRAKVWDASGSEPSSWDEELFRPIFSGATWHDYPYTGLDSQNILFVNAGMLLSPGVVTDNIDLGAAWTSEWDNLKVEYNPYGSPEDMSAAIERPEGTKVGEIVVPYGSEYFVGWGARDWTEPDGFGDFCLEYSARVWNDTAAAELQRAEAMFWWFRRAVGGPIDLSKLRFRGFEHGDI